MATEAFDVGQGLHYFNFRFFMDYHWFLVHGEVLVLVIDPIYIFHMS